MKRVIVLSFFKKMMNRFFGPDEDTNVDSVEQFDQIETVEKQERKQEPSFRFPIISDAEIYGWDDEPTTKRVIPKNYSEPIDTEDDYETKPLFENERWPGDDRPVNVYRAGSAQKKVVQDVVKKEALPQKLDPTSKRITVEESTNPKYFSKTFIPTSVPSPIYGYAKPKTSSTSGEEWKESEFAFSDAPDQDPEKTLSETNREEVDYISQNEEFTLHLETTVAENSTEVETAGIVTEETVHPMNKFTDDLELKNELESMEIAEGIPEDHAIETSTTPEETVKLLDKSSEISEQLDGLDLMETVEEMPEEYTVATSTSPEETVDLFDMSSVVPEQLNELDLTETIEEISIEHVVETSSTFEETTELLDKSSEVSEQLNVLDLMETVEGTLEEYPVETPTSSEETVDLPDISSDVAEQLNEINSMEVVEEILEVRTIEKSISDEEIDVQVVAPLGQVPEKKAEKIVPFNVLMLKSDKEKLEASKRTKTSMKKSQSETMENTLHADEDKVESEDMQQDTGSVYHAAASEIEETVEAEPYYAFPPLDYLIPPESQIEDTEWLESQSEKLEVALSHFAVQANVIEAVQGPTVTRFELTVGQGTKVSKVRNLTDDLKLALAAEDIRIQAPIPGRSSIGIEIPNRKTRAVRLSEVISTEKFSTSASPLEAVLGLSLTGEPITIDLRKMPHGMIAGATGSGKSVCINSILVSLLYKAAPTDLKMMLIDPKMVELAPFNGIPHLISPVITDVKAATAALKWAVAEMERRYELLAHAGVRDIERYNKLAMEKRQFSLKMPYLLIVIDELADLMMMAPADVEVSISRIAQKARACGIHLIIATQRPSVDVITGTIKANIPTRIAFSVSSQIDSRTIIDTPGAERLLGKGDMLYIGNGQSSAVRLQGTFVTDDEIERIIEHVQNEATPNYLFGQEELLATSIEEEETDPLFEDACIFVYEQGSASTSLLQRNFSIGYNRAAKLMDRMEKKGYISEQRGSKPRDVFLTESEIVQITDRPDY